MRELAQPALTRKLNPIAAAGSVLLRKGNHVQCPGINGPYSIHANALAMGNILAFHGAAHAATRGLRDGAITPTSLRCAELFIYWANNR